MWELGYGSTLSNEDYLNFLNFRTREFNNQSILYVHGLASSRFFLLHSNNCFSFVLLSTGFSTGVLNYFKFELPRNSVLMTVFQSSEVVLD